DGSTTFNLPDKRGRVSAGKDDMNGNVAGRLSTSYFGGVATSLGAVGGAEGHMLTIAEMPAHTHANTLNDPGHSHSYNEPTFSNTQNGGGASSATGTDAPSTSRTTSGITITNAAQGGDSAHSIVQPTIICNYIVRVI